MTNLKAPGIAKIREAAERIAPYANRTPVMTCTTLNDMTGASLFFKCENFQKTGAFKFRGACNAVFSLNDNEAKCGVIAHSSGNHAQAVALAAQLRGVKCDIVMPNNAPAVKRRAVEGYGATITECEPTQASRESTTEAMMQKSGAVLIHPYDDYRIIAGAGTAAMELMDEVLDLDIVMTPVGGGGLLSGTALAVQALSPTARVIAGEPEGADDAKRSFEAGVRIPLTEWNTIADGLITSLGERTFPIIRDHVHAIYTVNDDAIASAMRLVWERMKIVIEPSSAVPLACLLNGEMDVVNKRIGVILTGGNVELSQRT